MNIHVDYLILGQGISGTFVAHFLQKENASIIVIDQSVSNTASRVASGVINPVTGRRVVKTWMIDDILPFAEKAYKDIAQTIGIEPIIKKTSVLDFIPTQQMQNAFQKRIDENVEFLSFWEDIDKMTPLFNFPLNISEIKSSYNINLWTLLEQYRHYLKQKSILIETFFDWQQCIIKQDSVQYKNIIAKKIICCEGVNASQNPFFQQLPFAFNKGEALIIETPHLPTEYIYKMGYTIVPLQEKNRFWVGSSYQWQFNDSQPTAMFKQTVTNYLQHWLKVPFTVVDHIASIRPANIERRPFVGLHPTQNSVAILNGMGTKGCSLAPFFAYQLVHHLLYQKNIDLSANVQRFKILDTSAT